MHHISKLNQNLDFKLRMMKLYSELRFPFSRPKRKQLRSLIEEKLCTKKIDFQVESSFDQNSIPIFIISYNRLSYIQQTIAALEKYNLTNIHIIDNNSDYQPLLDYLGSLKYQVHFLKKNYGHRVLWDCEEFNHYIEDDMYIVTDPDLEFNPNLPHDFILQLYKLLGSYPNITKVGFAIKLDDLPDCEFSKKIRDWEGQFWKKKLVSEEQECYFADLDTTFALYRPGKIVGKCFFKALRVAGSYTARHLPWYEMFDDTEENKHYKQTADRDVASWTKDSEYYK